MSVVGAGLTGGLALAAAAVLAALLAPAAARARLVGLLVAGCGLGATLSGTWAASGTTWRLNLPGLLPLAGVQLAADALSGWFLLLIGAVSTVVGVYTMGYARRTGHGVGSRPALGLLAAFVATMVLVPVAASVATFLVVWELMAVTSLLLVLIEHARGAAVRSAGLWYAAMTQAGFVAILVGLVWLASAAHTASWSGLRGVAGGLPAGVKASVFLLCLFGFAGKAGAVPWHVWLPRAHAEAPSHVSALMSAAMVKVGVYGLLRVGFDLLGGGAGWWWLVVAGIGALSALYAGVQSAVANDIKRLLAYSTSENVGLILLAVGFSGLLSVAGSPVGAALAMAAGLLHALNHAGFKTLLFAGAGSVVGATGTRDLDQLGGLSRRMPATTAMVSLAALCAAALPPGNGFVSEWLFLQALLHPGAGSGVLVAVATPLAVAVVAATAGIGVATYVKAVGTGFLARPRSPAAAAAVESPPSMLVAMGMAAGACVLLAVAAAGLAPLLDRVLAGLGLGTVPVRGGAIGVRLRGTTAAIAPLWLAGGLIGLILVAGGLARLGGRARRRAAAAWDCGDGPLTARMEYTATSFAEPLQRVFDDVLRPESDVEVSHAAESAYHVSALAFRQAIPDRIEHRLYRPLLGAVDRLGRAARGIANGSVHRYLAYMLTAVIIVLLVGALR